MSDTWTAVLLVGAFTISFKAAGPVLLARRQLPARLASAFELLADLLPGEVLELPGDEPAVEPIVLAGRLPA